MSRRTSFSSAFAFILALVAQPAFSLQGGPVMPEYVQFEPADVTDVVNLNTGNFSYTIPLSEVPGPYGGFPLSMSYHAGIGPGQEATIVGLGWSLNAGGAINRTLRGTPDDQFHGGDLVFIYAYSTTSIFSVDVTLSYGPVGLNMSYNSMSGYGLNATVAANFKGFYLGGNFGTGGVGLNGGVGYSTGAGKVGIGGSVGLSAGGFTAGTNVGLTTASGVTIGASMGVSVDNGGKIAKSGSFGLSTKHAHIGLSTEGVSAGASYGGVGVDAGPGGVSVSASYGGIGGSVNLSSRGFSAGVSVSGTGLSVSAASDNSSSSSANTAGFTIPGYFSYSRSVYQSWVRQATSEHSYGYMYQGGPALLVDGPGEDYAPTGAAGTEGPSTGPIAWNWNFKGRSMDHIGDPVKGPLLPAYDVFDVNGQGVNGSFRAVSLTQHEIYMSVEALGGVNGARADGDDDVSQNPNTLFYLLKEGQSTLPQAQRRQASNDFDPLPDGAYPLTNYAYDYCYEDGHSDPSNVSYVGGQGDPARRALAENRGCSRYALLKSNHLNEGARLLYSRNLNTNLDLNKKYRNRMVFTFLGENGGYFEPEVGEPGSKLARDSVSPLLMSKNIRQWDHSSFGSDVSNWDEPILGVRQIQPILEDSSNIGRLKGFKITNPDGTQYYFEQPVRSLVTASYTTNQPIGGPAFIDKHDPRAGEDWRDILGDAWGAFINKPLSSVVDIGRWAVDLAAGSVSSFLFYSPNFTDACQDANNGSTDTYNYSYQMSTNPYATQWLLTEIKGPDFVEFNSADMAGNYGYQVKFNYAKPVHYAWRTPYAPPGVGNDSVPNLRLPKNGITPENCLSELYHASFGVKELVYLQSIETATHKAIVNLNDPLTDPRPDAKGWFTHWNGTYKPSNPSDPQSPVERVKEGVPIMVGTHFPIHKVTASGAGEDKVAFLYRRNDIEGVITYTKLARISWNEVEADYTLKESYLDVQPTKTQIDSMRGKEVVITGIDEFATHPKLKLSSDLGNLKLYWEDVLAGGIPDDQTPTFNAAAVRPGYFISNPAGKVGNTIKVVVSDIERAEGPGLRYGSYRMEFAQTSWQTYDGKLGRSFNVDFEETSHPAYISNLSQLQAPLVDTNNSVPLRLTSGGGDFFDLAPQPLLVFNQFIDFNDEPGANQMRYLKRIDFVDKKAPDSPTKRFAFDYKWDIQPNTLNSYDTISVTGVTDPVEIHRNSYPLRGNPGDPIPDNDLLGKMKLESVREVACAGINCADSMTLPPFRFSYQYPEMTPFVPRDTLLHTIRETMEKQDQWGFYNPLASEGNNKARNFFADKGGAAWSMNKVVDPSGGVMEILYERDTYYGEDYAEDDLAQAMVWDACPAPNNQFLCLDFMPKKWVEYCDRNDNLKGEWIFTHEDNEQGFDYIKNKGFVQGSEIFFNLQQTLATKVGCGVNLGFWKSGGCKRHRSVSIVGKANILAAEELTTQLSPVFDRQAYEMAGRPSDPGACTRGQDCCTVEKEVSPGNWVSEPLNEFWHCNYSIYRIRTDVEVGKAEEQFIKTAKKLRKRNWSIARHKNNERFGLAWSRQSNLVVKGGDNRVKELTKYDINLVQKTNYEYGIGQTTQYPDSAFSVAFATRFSTGKITDLYGADVAINEKFRNLPSQSRVSGITDDELNLLPGAQITYPKITVTNILKRADGSKYIANGKNEFEFFTPENTGFLHIKVPTFTLAANQEPKNIYVVYHSSSGNLFSVEKMEPKRLDNLPSYQQRLVSFDLVRMDSPEANGHKAKDITSVEFFYGLYPLTSGTVTIPVNSQTNPKVTLTLEGGFSGSTLAIVAKGTSLDKFDFAEPILRKVNQGGVTVFEDRTSRIGKPKSTAFYRWIPNAASGPEAGRYALAKKDSMVYSHAAPSVDKRFIASADAQKLGQFKERWRYERVRKCEETPAAGSGVPDCKSEDTTTQWHQYKAGDDQGPQSMAYVRFPTFLTKSVSITGFNNSRQPGEEPPVGEDPLQPGETDFIVTSVTNHRFDPITGQPTLSVAYAGRLPTSPSKVTLTTAAYTVDSGKVTTDLPNIMFAKNMLEQNFREDVFTFSDSTPANVNFDAVNLLDGTTDNGGALANYLTAVKLNPYQHKILQQVNGQLALEPDPSNTADVTQPIVAQGAFSPRFDLAPGGNLITRNRFLFAAQPNLQNWAGSHITKVNRFLKAVESKDAYGVGTSSRFDSRGLHQVGLFGNADYSETAVLTATGEDNICGRNPSAKDVWVWATTGGCPTISGGFVSMAGSNIDLRHTLDVKANGKYRVEFQAHSAEPREIRVAFLSSTGTVGDEVAVPMRVGLDKYVVDLDVTGGYGGSLPTSGNNRLVFQSLGSTGQVKLKYLRAYPKKSQSIIYVYNERGDMLQSVDVANVCTYYEYDLFGKLTGIRNDDGVMLTAGSKVQANLEE